MKTAPLGIRPAWVGLLDFQRRFPSANAKAMAAMQVRRLRRRRCRAAGEGSGVRGLGLRAGGVG
jgi:hypothetical protein